MTLSTVARRLDPTRLRSLAAHAALVGALAGILAAGFVSVAGEPALQEAIGIEEAAAPDVAAGDDDAHADGDEVVVSRAVQRGPGLFGGYALTGAAFGLLVSLVYFVSRPVANPFSRVLTTGGVLVGAIAVAPWLKYPPNPPAVGDPATLEARQLLYVGVIALTTVVGIAAHRLAGRLRRSGWRDHQRIAAVVTMIGLSMVVVFAALPGAPDPVDAPASLVWRFRLASLGGSAVLWTTLVVGFAVLVAEADGRLRRPGAAIVSDVLAPAPT